MGLEFLFLIPYIHVLHILTCINWGIFVYLEWRHLDHGEWSNWYVPPPFFWPKIKFNYLFWSNILEFQLMQSAYPHSWNTQELRRRWTYKVFQVFLLTEYRIFHIIFTNSDFPSGLQASPPSPQSIQTTSSLSLINRHIK